MNPPYSIPEGRRFDVACLGRLAVDLYAQQVGSRLEDVSTFAKYLGGSSANIAFGSARLGLRSAMISRVGDEQMGRFLLETLQREGCDVSQVQVDPERLTALALLGLKDRDTFPLLFYRENCADMSLCAGGIDPSFIADCRALLITGTHLSQPTVRAASAAALSHARQHGVFRVLDIDYRPVLWGLTRRGEGANRYVPDAAVTARLQLSLPEFELLIGTEEEFLIAGGAAPGDLLAALRTVRELTPATMVVKLGAQGCCIVAGPVPARLQDALMVHGDSVDVMNVLGAGDAFAAGLLSGLLRGLDYAASARIANACGAIVVSRHGCAPAMPTPEELARWLDAQGREQSPAMCDPELEHLHRVTAARPNWPELHVMAFDHRSQFLDLAREAGATAQRLRPLKTLLLQAAEQVERSHGLAGCIGVLVDGQQGDAALHAATGRGWWVGRPVELPGSRPLRFDQTRSVGSALQAWPREQVVKCLVYYHPDDETLLRLDQEARLLELWEATRSTGHELLLEIIVPNSARAAMALPGAKPQVEAAGADVVADEAILRAVLRLYNLGIKPEWWKLAPLQSAGWRALSELIGERDPHCRGAVILGLNQPIEVLLAAFRTAAEQPLVKGYMVGRTLWAEPARRWLRGELDDAALVARTAANFAALVEAWRANRKGLQRRAA